MITKAEIKTLAFGTNFDIAQIKDNVIYLVKVNTLLPILGTNLYDDVESTPANYTDLLDLIKPFLAWEVRKYVSHTITYKLGNKGAMIAQGVNEQPTEVINVKREAEKLSADYKKLITQWLETNKPALWKRPIENDFINKIIIM
jgi:hypothetical protein